MTHSFAPKHILAMLLIGFSLQANAQSETFAYANAKNPRSKSNEKNEMVRKGCKIDILQDASGELRFLVQIENPTNEKLVLFIRDNNNNTLHRETLNENQARFAARYNFTGMEDGDYVFEVRNGRNKLEKLLQIRTQTIQNRIVSVTE